MDKINLQCGIYNLSEEVYHAESFSSPCLSSGVIKNLLLKCPAIARIKHPALNPCYQEEEKTQFDIGHAAHALLLEGKDSVVSVDATDWRKNETKAVRDEIRANGYIPLLKHQYDEVFAMVKAAKLQLMASELGIVDLQTYGKSEQSMFWNEDNTWLKIRPDWRSNDGEIILDYKTTGNCAHPDGIGRIILNMGYDIQEALYRRGVAALTGNMPKFVFMFQETTEPYLCTFVMLNPQFREYADRRVEEGIGLWRDCLKTNEWPGYPLQICHLELPYYGQMKLEELRILEADGV